MFPESTDEQAKLLSSGGGNLNLFIIRYSFLGPEIYQGEHFNKSLHECPGTKCFVEYMRTKHELYFFLNMHLQTNGKKNHTMPAILD